eukprot:2181379-Prymnesium_polylepis.1
MAALDRTADFRAAVRQRRGTLGVPTPSDELLRPSRQRAPFSSDALGTLEKIAMMYGFLRDNHAAYMLDNELHGMSDAERDEVDAESQRFIKACGERIDTLRRQAAAAAAEATSSSLLAGAFGGAAPQESQLSQHEQAVVGQLYERLKQ